MSALSEPKPRPDHVPAACVYDFDYFADAGMIENSHDRVLEIRRQAPPVFWTPRNGGHWILQGYSAISHATRDPESFTVEYMPYEQIQAMKAQLPPGAPEPLVALPNSVDPPHHAIYRAPLQGVFGPKSILAMRNDIRALAIDLIEAVRPLGACEFMSMIAEPMPVTVFLKMFGLPVARQKEYRALVKEHFTTPGLDGSGSQGRLRKLADIMHDTILERRDAPQDDMISMLWQSEFLGKPATLNDLENYCVMLFLAGLDTVMNGMGMGMRHLADNPALQAQLRANPKLITSATEELIRRYSFTIPPRFVAKDMVFEGQQMKKGEMALLFLPSADLDPAVFPDPEKFDLERENRTHIAFGLGPHRCLGANLARVELQVLYEEVLARLPEFHIDPARPVRYHGGNVWGPDQLHLIWG